MSQSMENENAKCETLRYGCRLPTGFASEKFCHILRLEHPTRAVRISKAIMEYRTLHSVYAYQWAALSEAAGPNE